MGAGHRDAACGDEYRRLGLAILRVGIQAHRALGDDHPQFVGIAAHGKLRAHGHDAARANLHDEWAVAVLGDLEERLASL